MLQSLRFRCTLSLFAIIVRTSVEQSGGCDIVLLAETSELLGELVCVDVSAVYYEETLESVIGVRMQVFAVDTADYS